MFPKPALEVLAASVAFGGKPVFSDVSFELDYGGLVGLIGPNGAGKTTLLRSVLGEVPLASGAIRIDGHDRHIADRPRAFEAGVDRLCAAAHRHRP